MEEKRPDKTQSDCLRSKALDIFRAAVRLFSGGWRYIIHVSQFIGILFIALLLFDNHADLAKELLAGVIASLISAVLYSLAQGVQAADEGRAYEKQLDKIKGEIVVSVREDQERMSRGLQSEFKKALEDVSGACVETENTVRRMLLEQFPKYAAEAEYPSLSEGFDEKYNRDLMHSIRRSKEYFFFGPSAKYVAERVKYLGCVETLNVVMVCPNFSNLLHISLTKSSAIPRGSGGSGEDRQMQAYREELFGSIITIFDLRHDVRDIRIAYTTDPMVYRFDMTSEQTYLTLFKDEIEGRAYEDSPGKKPMPPAYRFSSSTLVHKMFRDELNQRFTVGLGNSIVFTGENRVTDLVDHLRKISDKNTSISESEINIWREKAHERSANLKKFLENMRDSG